MKTPSSPWDLAIALATLPTLAGLIMLQHVKDMMLGLGQSSEEIFRGDRLPILNISTSTFNSLQFPSSEQ